MEMDSLKIESCYFIDDGSYTFKKIDSNSKSNVKLNSSENQMISINDVIVNEVEEEKDIFRISTIPVIKSQEKRDSITQSLLRIVETPGSREKFENMAKKLMKLLRKEEKGIIST